MPKKPVLGVKSFNVKNPFASPKAKEMKVDLCALLNLFKYFG
jgi:hypothetical protein